MKNLTKLLTGTALATLLSFNSYAQDIKNVILAYVSIKGNEKKTFFNVDSLKPYNLSFVVKETALLDIMMGKEQKEDKSYIKTKLYLVIKTEKETRVIPTIIEGGYDFSKDSKKDVEKEVKKLIKDKKISISDVVKYGSEEMFMELDD
ncbi:MAG: hypothetical protein AABX44_01960 [Nanoarchaeota archaeon]